MRQDEIAFFARKVGLQWSRATVAAIETGRRQLSLEEFLILPYVLTLAHVYPEARPTRDNTFLELDQLLPNEGWIDLLPNFRVQADGLKRILAGTARETMSSSPMLVDFAPAPQKTSIEDAEKLWRRFWPMKKLDVEVFVSAERDTGGDAEQKAARNLRVSPLTVALAARKLWGRSLTEERDQRLPSSGSGQKLKGTRGHITRALLEELRPVLLNAGYKTSRKR